VDRLTEMLQAQRELQIETYGADPCALTGADRANYIRWNQHAMADESFEVLHEVGWKEWATSRHVNDSPAIKEMVDVWHFWMNIWLCLNGPTVLAHGLPAAAERLHVEYFLKRAENERRQADGYTGDGT
jgi:hypothetical protein